MQWAQLSENLKAIGGILLLPYVLYREIKEQILPLEHQGTYAICRRRRGGKELKALVDRLGRYRQDAPLRRERLCRGLWTSFLPTRPRLRPWLHQLAPF